MTHLPPPTGVPSPGASPVPPAPYPTAPPPSGGSRLGIGIAIGVGGVVLLGLIVGLVVAVSSLLGTLGSAPTAGGPSGGGSAVFDSDGADDSAPLDDGFVARGAHAVDPLDCDDDCLGGSVRSLAFDPAEYDAVGLDEQYGVDPPYGTVESHGWNLDSWAEAGGEPDECFFTISTTPHAFGADDVGIAVDDEVWSLGWAGRSSGTNVSQTVRVFAHSDGAVNFMARMEQRIAGCDDYRLVEQYYSATVGPLDGLELPDDVAAVGWIESGIGTARNSGYYSVDLQRGNLVERISLYSDGREPGEEWFRDLVERAAVALSELPVD